MPALLLSPKDEFKLGALATAVLSALEGSPSAGAEDAASTSAQAALRAALRPAASPAPHTADAGCILNAAAAKPPCASPRALFGTTASPAKPPPLDIPSPGLPKTPASGPVGEVEPAVRAALSLPEPEVGGAVSLLEATSEGKLEPIDDGVEASGLDAPDPELTVSQAVTELKAESEALVLLDDATADAAVADAAAECLPEGELPWEGLKPHPEAVISKSSGSGHSATDFAVPALGTADLGLEVAPVPLPLRAAEIAVALTCESGSDAGDAGLPVAALAEDHGLTLDGEKACSELSSGVADAPLASSEAEPVVPGADPAVAVEEIPSEAEPDAMLSLAASAAGMPVADAVTEGELGEVTPPALEVIPAQASEAEPAGEQSPRPLGTTAERRPAAAPAAWAMAENGISLPESPLAGVTSRSLAVQSSGILGLGKNLAGMDAPVVPEAMQLGAPDVQTMMGSPLRRRPWEVSPKPTAEVAAEEVVLSVYVDRPPPSTPALLMSARAPEAAARTPLLVEIAGALLYTLKFRTSCYWSQHTFIMWPSRTWLIFKWSLCSILNRFQFV